MCNVTNRAVLAVIVVGFLIAGIFSADITAEQFQKTKDIHRDICQVRVGVTNEQIESIKKDSNTFDDDSQEKCYATCILQMLNLVIDGKIPTTLASKTIDLMLPDALNTRAREGLNKCRSFLAEDIGNKHCTVGHNMFKCLADNDLMVIFF